MGIGSLPGALGGTLALGVLVGLTGIGGFLLPPWLRLTLAMPPAQAVPLTLLGFTISSLVATAFYARSRAVDFSLAALLVAAALPGIGIGLFAGARLSPQAWSHLIGVMLVVIALWLLRPTRADTRTARTDARWWVGGAGLLAGVCAVVAGVTGPLIMLPGLRIAGVPSTTAVGTSLLASVGVSLAGVIGYGTVGGWSHRVAVYVVPAVVIGTAAGALLSRRVEAPALNGLIRALCAAAGLWMLLR
jgi:uncharacterized membrane protein YfcA